MKDNRSIRCSVILILTIGLWGCGESHHDTSSNSPAPNNQGSYLMQLEEPVESLEVCYFGDLGQNDKCLTLDEFDDILHPQEYIYLDPNSDPSFPRGFSKQQYRRPSAVLDLADHPQATRLSENFSLSEFVQKFKGQYGVLATHLLQNLQLIRYEYGQSIVLNSVYRSPHYNTGVGGAKWSRHQYGDAVDISATGTNQEEIQELCKKYGASFTLIYQYHVHCDWRHQPLDDEFYGPALTPAAIEFTTQVMARWVDLDVKVQDNLLMLSVKHPALEDSGQLTYSWEVLWPNGKTVVGTNENFITRAQGKKFSLKLVIGGSIVITRRVHLKK